jgi:hypothetical protein
MKKKRHEKIDLPEEVIESMREHFKKSCSKCKNVWNIAEANENMTTGSILSNFAMEWRDCDGWKWRITVDPTGSIKPETISGADGIISVNVEREGVTQNKSIIFQAKKEGNAKKLKSQIKKMKEILPGGNMLIIYSKDGLWGQTVGKNDKNERIELADYISDVFLKCRNGCLGVTLEDVKKKIQSAYLIIEAKQNPPNSNKQ